MVPPVAVAVNVTEVPDFAVLGPVTATAKVIGETVTVADADAVFALLSVAVTPMVYVPLASYVVLKLVPEPVAGAPPVVVQANE